MVERFDRIDAELTARSIRAGRHWIVIQTLSGSMNYAITSNRSVHSLDLTGAPRIGRTVYKPERFLLWKNCPVRLEHPIIITFARLVTGVLVRYPKIPADMEVYRWVPTSRHAKKQGRALALLE